MSNGNESAFAVCNQTMDGPELIKGLTKREWMAATILQGLLAGRQQDASYSMHCYDAVQLADNLLKQLEQ